MRKEWKLNQSIKNKQKTLQVTDKSGIFHIDHVKDHEKKAEAYREKIKAYIELDEILRPLFDKHIPTTEIIDGVNLIRRLETYVSNGYLKPTTYLCTFDIIDLYTMLQQEESLTTLTEFLQHGYHNVKGVPINGICIYLNIG